jgi:hypothetical protein
MVHSITKPKNEADAHALTDSLNQLKEQFLSEYKTVRQALDDAVSEARAAKGLSIFLFYGTKSAP